MAPSNPCARVVFVETCGELLWETNGKPLELRAACRASGSPFLFYVSENRGPVWEGDYLKVTASSSALVQTQACDSLCVAE